MRDKQEMQNSLIQEVKELRAELADLRKGEKKYLQWFEDAPISLWEQDYSEVKRRVDEIREGNAGDLEAYFHFHSEVVRELAELVRVVDVNKFTLRLYRAESKESFLSGIARVFSRESYDSFALNLLAVAEGKRRFFTERSHVTMDGERIDVHIHWAVVPGYEDTYARVLVSIVDITERRRMEEALRASEEKYRLIADNMADTVWIMDMNMHFTYVSPSVKRMYGSTVEEVLDQPVTQSLTPESVQKALNVFAEESDLEARGNADPERTRIMELEEYKKDGSTIWVESSMSFLRDEDRKPIGILGISRDITERKNAEAERATLEAQNRQLQKAESLGRMAGAIAHHFNNQLQAVMGNLELAMGDSPQSEGSVKPLAEAMKAAQSASLVSRRMLTYLGQTTGKQDRLDLSDACRLALPVLKAALPKDVMLEIDLPDEGPAVKGNPNEIQQVIANLVANAWESMDEDGGFVRIAVKTIAGKDIPELHGFPVGWQPEEADYACLEVEDSGCGIAEQNMEKVFDPFYSSKFMGRGLGLPVALGIVRAHGGAITVESAGEMGKKEGRGISASLPEKMVGSVFRVFLPLSFEGAPLRSEIEAPSREVPEVDTALLVEDTPEVRELGTRMLELLRFRVLAAKDGVEGVEIFRKRQNEIRFVLCDLTMPRMDGWKTIAALRQMRPDIPVILTSGYDEASVMSSAAHSERPQTFLNKPYSFKDLREAIGKLIACGEDRDGRC